MSRKEAFNRHGEQTLRPAAGGDSEVLQTTDYLIALAEFNLGQLETAEKLARAILKNLGDSRAYRPDREKINLLLAMITERHLAREADSLSGQGRFEEAREAYSRLYSSLEERLGLEHQESLAARYNVARMYELEGRAAARDLYESLAALQEKALGPDHQYVLTTRRRLAQLGSAPAASLPPAQNNGDADPGAGSAPADKEALSQHLAELEKKSGQDHPDTLAVREKLADLLTAKNDQAKAEKEYAAIAALRERKQGRDHLDALRIREKLAQALAAQG